MPVEHDHSLPEFDESSIVAVHLLQGVVYQDEERVWDLVLNHRSRLDAYFGRLGLRLVVDEGEGFAFLRQLDDSELENVRGYDQVPKLFRKKRLSYDATLACACFGKNCAVSRKKRWRTRDASSPRANCSKNGRCFFSKFMMR